MPLKPITPPAWAEVPLITKAKMPLVRQLLEQLQPLDVRPVLQYTPAESDDVSGSVSDSLSQPGEFPSRSATDNPSAPVETLTRLDGLPRSESDDVSSSVSDSLSRTQGNRARTSPDVLSALTEAFTRLLPFGRVPSDNFSASASDSLSRLTTASRSRSESLGSPTEALARAALAFLRSKSDTISTPSETLTRVLTTALHLFPTISDALAAITENFTKPQTFLRALADPPSSGALEPVTTYGGGFLQAVAIADEAVWGTPFMLQGGDVEGPWRSVDHGNSWRPTADGGFFAFSDKNISAVEVSPAHAGWCYMLYGVASGGLAYSSDSGRTWSQIAGLDNTQGGSFQPRAEGKLIAIDAGATPSTDNVYVGTNNGVLKSVPFGHAFQAVALGRGDTATLVGAITASALPQTVQVSGLPTYWASGMSVKIDSETIQISVVDSTHIEGIWAANHTAGANKVIGQGFRISDLVLDPNDHSVAYATFLPANSFPVGFYGSTGGAVYRISGLPSAPVVTLIDTSLPLNPGGLEAVDIGGGVTALVVGCQQGIRRSLNPRAATPSWTTISTGLTDAVTGATFDNSSANWNGISGWYDGAHLHVLVAASPGTGYLPIPGSTKRQCAWRIDNAEGSPTAVLIGATAALCPTTLPNGDAWWFAFNSGALFGGSAYAVAEVRSDPNNRDRAYWVGRAGMWGTQNAQAAQPSVNPMVVGYGGTYNQHAAIDPQNPAHMLLGDTDWTLLGSHDRFATASGLFRRADYVPGGANNGVTETVEYDTTTNPSGAIVGGGNRNSNNFGYIKYLADADDPTSLITDEAPVGSGWPGGKSGDSASLRCLAGIQILNGSGTRVLIAIADSSAASTGAVTGYGIYVKPGAPGAGTWTQADATLQSGQNQSPALAWAAGTAHVYAFDVVNKRILHSNNYGAAGSWSVLWTTTDACDSQGQGFLAVDPTQPDRVYVTTRLAVYKLENTWSGAPTVTVIGTGVIQNPGIVQVAPDGAAWVTQISSGLLASSARAFWRSADHGASWSDISSPDFRACCIWPNSFKIASDGTALLADSGQGGWVGNPLLTTYSFTPTDVVTIVRTVGLILTDGLTAIGETIGRALHLIPAPTDTVAAPADSASRASQSFTRSITEAAGALAEFVVRDLHLHAGGVSLAPLVQDALAGITESVSRASLAIRRSVSETVPAPSEVLLRGVQLYVSALDAVDAIQEVLGSHSLRAIVIKAYSRSKKFAVSSRDRILKIWSR